MCHFRWFSLNNVNWDYDFLVRDENFRGTNFLNNNNFVGYLKRNSKSKFFLIVRCILTPPSPILSPFPLHVAPPAHPSPCSLPLPSP